MRKTAILLSSLAVLFALDYTITAQDSTPAKSSVIAPGAELKLLAEVFSFTEGPAADAKGNVYFTDQPNDKIYIFSTDGKLSVFLEGCERSNGLYFDANGDLLACADLYNKLVSFDMNGKMTVLIDNYRSKLLNAPNDLWRDPKGGIYFTDPFYKRDYWNRGPSEQDGRHVYYLKPDRKTLIRVTEDLEQPNGIIGTPDGKLLYVADIKAWKTYVYNINEDGTLSNKKLFCETGSDGMTIDDKGNVYLTGKGVPVFNPAGEQIDHIDVNEGWTANITFGGPDFDTLFITASDSLYAVKTKNKGVTWTKPAAKSVVAPGAKAEKLSGGFVFTEGPAADAKGNVYFTDIPNNRIHVFSTDGKLSTFRENSRGANGLYFDPDGNLLACEGGGRQLVSIDPRGNVTILADSYKAKKLNSLNDLWRAPNGGIYVTDPRYGRSRDNMEQDGEHVYYLPPGAKELIRVIDDMVRPNGLIGTADGKLLYIADHGDSKTWACKVNPDGTLADKKLFANEGSDGMTIDNEGNIYLTTDAVKVYNAKGQKIETIKIPQRPSNVCFGGPDNKTLFITARTSLYSLDMRTKGL